MSQKEDTMNSDDYQKALDEKLAAAMEIPVPELVMPELPDIETAGVEALSDRRSLAKPVWLALAATVLLAAFVGIRMTGTTASDDILKEQVLAHVDREPGAIRASNSRVSDERLARMVPDTIATMNHDSGLITYAQSCTINGREVPHLVMQGVYGPITILLMPHEKVAEATTLDGVNVKGIILPVGDGSIAIIGDRQEQFDQVRENVVKSVTWST